MLHHKVALRDKHGNILKWYGSSLDIEDHKHAEEQLRRSAQELQRSESYLAEGQRLAHMGSWAFDAAGFDYWSPELFRMHGLEPASKAPTVQEYLDCVHPQDREFMADLIKRILAEPSRFDTTKRIVRPDGEVRYIRCVGTPIVENQALKKFVGTAIDVTEYELLTQELHRREAYLTEAQRLSHTGSFGWRPDTGEIVWSDETYRIFEYDRAVKPTIDLVVQRVHPEDRVDFQDVIDRASGGATHFEHAYRLLLPDGRVKHVDILAHALQDESGNREFVGAVMDVTKRKRAEEAFRSAQIELAHVTRVATLGEMTASIAHEINQPLGAMVNNASACVRWLAAQNLEEARQSAARVIAEGHRAADIIGRIRALTKKAPPQKDWLDINHIIREVIALAQSEVQRNRIALETQLSDDVPFVFADRIQLQQVMLNLIMNAMEAMTQVTGPRALCISSGAEDAKGVVVVVQDSGAGLDAKSLERLFEPFYTTKPQGMGMGLAICRSIIEAHGGRLWATTNRDRGASLHFTLPPGKELG